MAVVNYLIIILILINMFSFLGENIVIGFKILENQYFKSFKAFGSLSNI